MRFGVLVGLLMVISMPVWAVTTPTSDQLRMLQSLNASQRNQLIGLLGGGGASRIPPKREVDRAPSTTRTMASEANILSAENVSDDTPGLDRLISGDTLILYLTPDLKDQKNQLEVALTASQLLFSLDQYGVLSLPNLGNIPLAGLTVEEAVARLSLESFFDGYRLDIKRLPLIAYGKAALKPFGYDLFKRAAGDMQPTSNIPVPANYVVGPGDVIYIQLIGKKNQEYALEVSRNGTLSFPGVGAIPVIGLRFDEVKANLTKRVARQFIGVSANITLGELRSMRVFVLGEVMAPGSYVVGALASVTNALMQVGGVKPIGSLRNITVKRKGKIVQRLDLYDLLLQGDTSHDIRLQPDDVVYVPPVSQVVGIAGAVTRPGLYEMAANRAVQDALNMAGGLLPQANRLWVQVERYDARGLRHLIDLDLTRVQDQHFLLQSGDILNIEIASQMFDKAVHIEGNVVRQGWRQWQPDMRITDVIRSVVDVKPQSDLDYVIIARRLLPADELVVFSVNLLEVFNKKDQAANVPLLPNDHLMVFENNADRHTKLKQLVSQLKLQATQEQAAQIVRISGNVHFPDTYPLEKGMRVSDLLRAGGGLQDSAFIYEAELTRFQVEQGLPRKIRHISVSLADVLDRRMGADSVLMPYDLLHIKEVPHWAEQDQVEVLGEVNYPGRYPIQRGETLVALLARAGGITPNAYVNGAVFMREDLRQREQKRLDDMATNLESELATLSLERRGDATASQGLAPQLLKRLRTTKAAGRLVIDLGRVLDNLGTEGDIILRGGDKLYIPPKMQEVTVIGEVFYPTSHLYQSELVVDDFIKLSGGITPKSDEENMYVIRANGAVELAVRDWFEDEVELYPGDTIVVPLDADRISNLQLWSSISAIVYQLGLSAAAWNSLGIIR